MYIPNSFKVSEGEAMAFIEANAFGQLISLVGGKLYATHLPLLLNEDTTKLLGHLAKPNPQWQNLEDQEILVIFAGPHDYVSPSWYQSPGVPTWNYQAVHVYGTCRIFDDAQRLMSLVDRLTHKYEKGFAAPWQPEYKSTMLQAIVGVEIDILEVQGKYKLSQNRSEVDRESVAAGLDAQGSNSLAAAVRATLK